MVNCPVESFVGQYIDLAFMDMSLTQIYPENKAHAAKAPSDAKQPIVGKEGALYFKHGAFCLETQNFPDAVNHVRAIYTALFMS